MESKLLALLVGVALTVSAGQAPATTNTTNGTQAAAGSDVIFFAVDQSAGIGYIQDLTYATPAAGTDASFLYSSKQTWSVGSAYTNFSSAAGTGTILWGVVSGTYTGGAQDLTTTLASGTDPGALGLTQSNLIAVTSGTGKLGNMFNSYTPAQITAASGQYKTSGTGNAVAMVGLDNNFGLNATPLVVDNTVGASGVQYIQTVSSNPGSPTVEPGTWSFDGTSIAYSGAATQVTAKKDVRTYVPQANDSYTSFLRVINTGTLATPVYISVIDDESGNVGVAELLAQNLAPGAATTFSAQQVENALGSPLAPTSRPRIRVLAIPAATLNVQSFLLQPGGAFNEVSAAQSGSSLTLPTYIPAAGAPSGYQSYLRVINTGTVATAVTIAYVNSTNGVAGNAMPLIASLPAGAAQTMTASQIEGVLGLNLAASERPTMILTGASSTLDAQSFLTQPGGAFTNVSSIQSGSTIDVRSYIPAAATGYASYIRVLNNGGAPAAVTATVLDDVTGALGATGTIIASLANGAAMTLTSSQIEAALAVNLAAGDRPRLRISAAGNLLTVQSFMLQPGGAFNEFSGAQTGTTVAIRTYIPAADAVTGYSSFVRIINTGATATPVTVALIDASSGTTGTAAPLIASLAAGGAQSFTPSQVETALGVSIAAGSRPRLLISGNGSNVLEVQSFLIQPGGVFSEVSGGQ